MILRRIAAALMAAMLVVQLPAAALANKDGGDDNNQRDTQSRNEQAALRVLPLLLGANGQMQVVMMVLMMQHLTYQVLMQQGVNVTSQNRVGLGGLFGGVFAKTYSASDFLKSLEVGTVYRAGDDKVAVALKGNLRLEDYRIIVFNGENQFDITGNPAVQQVDPQILAQLGTISLITQMLTYSLDAGTFDAVVDMEMTGDVSGQFAQQYLSDIPLLRRLRLGKVYIGANNTLLIVIPPAIVLER